MTLNFTVFHELTNNFNCQRCSSKDAYTQFILNNTSETVVLGCKQCGFVEFYDYNILDQSISK